MTEARVVRTPASLDEAAGFLAQARRLAADGEAEADMPYVSARPPRYCAWTTISSTRWTMLAASVPAPRTGPASC
jgi:hypothetical protein